MKKLIALILITVMAFGICACGMPTDYSAFFPPEYDNRTTAPKDAPTAPQTNPETQPQTEPKPDPVLSPESAVTIFLNNVDTWILEDRMYMAGYQYLFLDLDFDGVLELIATYCDGSGRYSDNHYYRINLSDYSIETVVVDNYDDYNQVDYTLTDYPKLLRETSTNRLFYIKADMVRVGMMASVVEYESYFENETLKFNSIFQKYISLDSSSNPQEEEFYRVITGENSPKIDKSAYEQAYEEYYHKYDNLNLTYGSVYGSDFAKASDSERYGFLLEAYESFSYSGFDFDSVETFDADVELITEEVTIISEPTAEKLYCLADYNGLTVNDIADMWGADFELGNGLYKGGWKGFYYSDRRIPVTFFYAVKSAEDQSHTGSEPLQAINVQPSAIGSFEIAENISADLTIDELQALIPEGKSYYMEIDGTNNFSFDYNGATIIYTWNDDYVDSADVIMVGFY